MESSGPLAQRAGHSVSSDGDHSDVVDPFATVELIGLADHHHAFQGDHPLL
jgi:hypothetical protein